MAAAVARDLHPRLAAAVSVTTDDTAALGDLPDELIDPLTSDLLNDPLRLPSSRIILSRSTVVRVLGEESRDPYNREYCTVDMCEDVPQMRDAVQAWVEARRRGDDAAAAAAIEAARAVLADPGAADASNAPATPVAQKDAPVTNGTRTGIDAVASPDRDGIVMHAPPVDEVASRDGLPSDVNAMTMLIDDMTLEARTSEGSGAGDSMGAATSMRPAEPEPVTVDIENDDEDELAAALRLSIEQ